MPLIVFLKLQKAYIAKQHKLLPWLQARKISAILCVLICFQAQTTFTEIIFSSSVILSLIQGASSLLFNKKYRKGFKVFVKGALLTLLNSSVLSRVELYYDFHTVEMQIACFKAYCVCFSSRSPLFKQNRAGVGQICENYRQHSAYHLNTEYNYVKQETKCHPNFLSNMGQKQKHFMIHHHS